MFTTLSRPSRLKGILEQVPHDILPDDKREMIEKIGVTDNSISFPAGPAGSITLEVSRLEEPELIEYCGVGSPMPIFLRLHITPVSATACEGEVEIGLDIPMMMKPMVSGMLQPAVKQFGDMLAEIPFGSVEA